MRCHLPQIRVKLRPIDVHHVCYAVRGLSSRVVRCGRAGRCQKIANFGRLDHHGWGGMRPATPVADSSGYHTSLPQHDTWWMLPLAELRAPAFWQTLAGGGGTFPPDILIMRRAGARDRPSWAGLSAAMRPEVRTALRQGQPGRAFGGPVTSRTAVFRDAAGRASRSGHLASAGVYITPMVSAVPLERKLLHLWVASLARLEASRGNRAAGRRLYHDVSARAMPPAYGSLSAAGSRPCHPSPVEELGSAALPSDRRRSPPVAGVRAALSEASLSTSSATADEQLGSASQLDTASRWHDPGPAGAYMPPDSWTP